LYKLVASLIILCAPAGASAQAAGPSSSQGTATSSKTAKIAAITVIGTHKFPADQIAKASGLKPGDVVTAEQIQAAADRLAALGIFSAVNYRFSSSGDAISLEFQVQEATTYPLSFDNFPWFSDEEIAQAIRQQVGLFTAEAPDGGAMLDAITIAVENLLASRQIKGNVTHQLLAQPSGDRMMMQFRVDSPSLKVERVQFGDSLATNSEKLKDRIPDIKGQPYSRYAIEVFENEHVRPIYASNGYLRAKIGSPQPHLAGDSSNPAVPGVDILIPVDPGPIYSWNGISWQGNAVIGSANLDGAVELKPGDVADGMKLEALWQKISSEYARHGYLDAKVNPQPQFDDAAHKVSYRVSITEGPQYRMGEMVITGLSLDAEKRLRSVWLLMPGQAFDNGYFEKLAKELERPTVDIFGEMPIHYTEFGHWLRPNTDKHTVDVLLDFK
jgi:outer membrane protein insertion porin family